MSRYLISTWEPEVPAFWHSRGKPTASRNLWISIPALMLAFAIWMVWSVVVVNLPSIGFKYSTNQLFWLAAVPGLSGATLRIFYSFMVPIFGGRKWTAISTASLLIPASGIGFAVQDPTTSYPTMLVLSLLCGFGGGNFASSMANISFFYPKAQKGYALGMNAGLGNLGVSAVQFVVPLVITFALFGGEPQTWTKAAATRQMWLQNAGFVWVPFILVSTLAAWFGMNDLASAKASFAEQAVIFKRKHNWLMCILYLGTFGSFLGYAAGFPLLIKSPGGLVVEVTDGTDEYNADHYRVSFFYDLAKAAVGRMAFALAHELAPHGATALSLTPGWLRSEAMLDAYQVSEANWQDATKFQPHFAISETPAFVGRAVTALAADPDRARWNGHSLSSGQLAQVYGFTDLDGSQPDAWRYLVEVQDAGKIADVSGYR